MDSRVESLLDAAEVDSRVESLLDAAEVFRVGVRVLVRVDLQQLGAVRPCAGNGAAESEAQRLAAQLQADGWKKRSYA